LRFVLRPVKLIPGKLTFQHGRGRATGLVYQTCLPQFWFELGSARLVDGRKLGTSLVAVVEGSVKQGKDHDDQSGNHSQRHGPAAGRDKHAHLDAEREVDGEVDGGSC